MKDLIKLYIGPMSANIVDSVIELHNETKIPFGFCVSRRQVEFDGGYVNNWTTQSFVEYIKRKSNILICRDHGGPWQGIKKDDGEESFKYDSKFMDLIHIDPWKKFNKLEDGIDSTIEYIKFCDRMNPSCYYEVGTEEAIKKISPDELYQLLFSLNYFLDSRLFKRIKYSVIQSGTFLKEVNNTGEYDKQRLIDMLKVCKIFGVLSKEHNGDYLDSEIIKEKFDLGLTSINIAPEFGVIETNCILNRINSQEILDQIFDICYKSKRWEKWVDPQFDPEKNKEKLVKICCHYVYSDSKLKEVLAPRSSGDCFK